MSDTRSDELETTIGQLPANGTLADTDAIPTEKSGGSGVKTTLAQIKTFIQNAFNSVFAKKTDLDDYAKSSDVADTYAKKTDVADTYAKKTDVADTYETKANASSTYAKKLTVINKETESFTMAPQSEIWYSELDITESGKTPIGIIGIKNTGEYYTRMTFSEYFITENKIKYSLYNYSSNTITNAKLLFKVLYQDD